MVNRHHAAENTLGCNFYRKNAMPKSRTLLPVSILLLSLSAPATAAPHELLGPNGWLLHAPHVGDAVLTQTTIPGDNNPGENITVSAPSDPFYMIQIVRDIPGKVPAGHLIQMTLSARSATSNLIRLSVEKADKPYTAVVDKKITLTQNWQRYTIDGTSVDFGSTGISAHVQVGQQAGTVELKDISVQDLGPDPAIAAAELALRPDQIQARINRYRKGVLKISVLDASGRPVKNAVVRIQQTRHAFLFGCNVFGYSASDHSPAQKAYQDRFAALFNYATVPFYWGGFEPNPGQRDYDRIQAMTDWCLDHRITPKGHPLVWHTVWPGWAPSDPDAAIPALHARVTDLITHYQNTIHYWDVINEANSSAAYVPTNGESQWIKRDGPASVVETALDWARRAGKSNHDTFLYNDFDTTYVNLDMLAQLKKDGKLPDAIGIQAHMHDGTWSPRKTWTLCQNFSQLGRPIHITEITVLSGLAQGAGETQTYKPTTPEGEAAQGAYVKQFYTILFSHPAVQAITWWDLSDHNAWRNAPAGLLHEDMSPKPAYTQLLSLIHKTWWTDETKRTDAHGALQDRVFYGAYTITATDSHGHTLTKHVFFPEGSEALTVTLADKL